MPQRTNLEARNRYWIDPEAVDRGSRRARSRLRARRLGPCSAYVGVLPLVGIGAVIGGSFAKLGYLAVWTAGDQ
jgi:hypothetical protein